PLQEKPLPSRKCRAGLICRSNERLDIGTRVRRRDDPVQAVGWSYVNSEIQQSVDELGISFRIHVLAIIAIVANRFAIGEVNLKHRPEALHDRLQPVSTKNLPKPGDRGITNSVKLLVDVRIEHIQVCGYDFHGQSMPVERAIVQNHLLAPLHAIENGPRPHHRAHRESCAQSLAEGTQIWLYAVIFLAAARSIAE